jgi:hypothetical protein
MGSSDGNAGGEGDAGWLRLELARLLLRANHRLDAQRPDAAAWLADQLEALARRHRAPVRVAADDAEGWVRLKRARRDRVLLLAVSADDAESRPRWGYATPQPGEAYVSVEAIAAALARWLMGRGADEHG